MIKQGKVWGETSPLFSHNNVELHYAKINKGGYCSKHCHKHKSNRFIVLSGALKVTIWNEYCDETLEDVSILGAGEECTVPPGKYHQFEALENCVILEVYWVDLDQNDIVRKNHGGMAKNEASTNLCNEGVKAVPAGKNGSDQAALCHNIDGSFPYPVEFLGADPCSTRARKSER
jgi:mannose-6-phosphate isomerase-like protein (cupin superfamily)